MNFVKLSIRVERKYLVHPSQGLHLSQYPFIYFSSASVIVLCDAENILAKIIMPSTNAAILIWPFSACEGGDRISKHMVPVMRNTLLQWYRDVRMTVIVSLQGIWMISQSYVIIHSHTYTWFSHSINNNKKCKAILDKDCVVLIESKAFVSTLHIRKKTYFH